jgi:hypothetical protein
MGEDPSSSLVGRPSAGLSWRGSRLAGATVAREFRIESALDAVRLRVRSLRSQFRGDASHRAG